MSRELWQFAGWVLFVSVAVVVGIDFLLIYLNEEKSWNKSKVIRVKFRKKLLKIMSGFPGTFAFDEYGRPFIILREQDKQKRITGTDAIKVRMHRILQNISD